MHADERKTYAQSTTIRLSLFILDVTDQRPDTMRDMAPHLIAIFEPEAGVTAIANSRGRTGDDDRPGW
jgi:hypothetical protein